MPRFLFRVFASTVILQNLPKNLGISLDINPFDVVYYKK